MDTKTLIDRTADFLSGRDIPQAELPILRSVVLEHQRLYYEIESPVIADVEFDQLYALLVALEDRYDDRTPDSPTARVGEGVSEKFTKHAHLSPMLSLDNSYDPEDLREFEKRIRNILKTEEPIEYALEPKFDGLGVSLRYDGGELVRGLTRGNGMEGEDITENLRTIANIPKQIPHPETIEIRGEIILPHADFARVNEERKARGEKLFANPRNAASGSVRQLDASVTAGRGLRFYAYSCPLLEDGALTAYSDVIDRLESLGFSTTRVSFEIFSDIERLIVRIGELTAHRPTLGFDIDGMVVKMNRIADWRRAGFTAHHPRYAIAYKFPAELARTRVADVLHSVGRSGIVTPVAILDATPIGGVTVGRATLHNYSELALKDVRIGDHAWLMRAGEVIPEIVSVITEARDGSEIIVERPETCPVCGTKLANDEGKIAWYCPNRTDCPAQLQGGMEVFVGKHGMDIDGLGKKQIALFRKLGILSDFASVYHLREHRDTLLGQEGYKEKSVGNLLAAIETSREAKLENLLVALWIPSVGRRTARALASYFAGRLRDDFGEASAEHLFALTDRLTHEDLETVPDVGPVASVHVLGYFEENRDRIERLLPELTIVFPESTPVERDENHPLAGMRFCVTGSFEGYSREDLVALGESAGAAFSSSVGKNLNFLLAGEKAGSKLEKASALGISVWTLEEFLGKITRE